MKDSHTHHVDAPHAQPCVLPHLPPPGTPLSPSAHSRTPDSSLASAPRPGEEHGPAPCACWARDPWERGEPPSPRCAATPAHRMVSTSQAEGPAGGEPPGNLWSFSLFAPAQVQAASRTRMDRSRGSAAHSAKPGARLQRYALLPGARGNSTCRSGMLGKRIAIMSALGAAPATWSVRSDPGGGGLEGS